jgi:antagonist of KipI
VIEVLKAGLLTTVQDAGRFGWRACGMPVAGAMDRHAHAVANLLAGNAPGAAALEMTLLGATLRFDAAAYVAIGGADLRPELDGTAVRTWSAFPVTPGSVLACGSAAAGARAYLAVRGGIDVPPVMGSRSTYARAAVGGLAGRALRAGDRLPIGRAAERPSAPRRLAPAAVPSYASDISLRVILGPQDDRFTARGIATLLDATYVVTARNDRMGYQLEGPAIEHAHGPDIVSDALCPGAVQVPGDGRPIVMAVDAQTVGGYAKIATVVGPDLAWLAQARQGDRVRFAAVTIDEAVAAVRAERERFERLRAALGEA